MEKVTFLHFYVHGLFLALVYEIVYMYTSCLLVNRTYICLRTVNMFTKCIPFIFLREGNFFLRHSALHCMSGFICIYICLHVYLFVYLLSAKCIHVNKAVCFPISCDVYAFARQVNMFIRLQTSKYVYVLANK